jgi:hypothetical protein
MENQEMSERRDDTPERDEPSRHEQERKPGSYYYDDSTGYEIYDPAKDDEDDEPKESRDLTTETQRTQRGRRES